MTTKRVTTKKRIPEFKSREDEAKFWDSHDTTEFEAEFKPVHARFAKNLTEGITIRLDSETLGALRDLAHEKGVGPTTLVRMWLIERLGDEGKAVRRRAVSRR